MKKLYGVITAMTTPFTEDDKVNKEALEQQVDFLDNNNKFFLFSDRVVASPYGIKFQVLCFAYTLV